MVRITSFVISFILLCISSCKDSGTNPPPPPLQPKSVVGKWQFVAFESVGDSITWYDPTDTAFLWLSDTGRFFGRTHGLCWNTYGGTYATGANRFFHTDSLFSAYGYCPLSQYWRYYSALDSISTYDVTDTTLFLYYGGFWHTRLNFVKRPFTSL